MPKVKKINHVALVVEDIDAALMFWRDALGLELEKMSTKSLASRLETLGFSKERYTEIVDLIPLKVFESPTH